MKVFVCITLFVAAMMGFVSAAALPPGFPSNPGVLKIIGELDEEHLLPTPVLQKLKEIHRLMESVNGDDLYMAFVELLNEKYGSLPLETIKTKLKLLWAELKNNPRIKKIRGIMQKIVLELGVLVIRNYKSFEARRKTPK